MLLRTPADAGSLGTFLDLFIVRKGGARKANCVYLALVHLDLVTGR